MYVWRICDKCKIIKPKKCISSDLEFRWYMKVRIRLKKENTFFDDVIKVG